MPQIPVFENRVEAQPAAPALANRAAFGQVGDAFARAGAGLASQAGEIAQRYADARRQADAANLVAAASAKLGELQFQYSKVPDSAAAIDGFNKDAGDYTKQLLDGIQDPLIRSHVSERIGQEAAIRAMDTRNAAFGVESATRRGQLETRLSQYAQSAAATDNELLRGKIADDGQADISGSVAAGWLRPDEGAKLTLQLRSEMATVRVEKMLNGAVAGDDADAANGVAQQLSDPAAFPGLSPERRESLMSRAEGTAYRLAARAAAKVAHEDSEAARNLRTTQSNNETNLLADVYAGKTVDPRQLEQLARAQLISPSGLEAVHSALDRRSREAVEGRDNPTVAAQMWAGASPGGSTTKEDVLQALSAGQLKTSTASEMMRTLNERGKQQNDAVERGAFATLRTALSGSAIEQGFADKIFGDTKKNDAVQAWAQAQGEWNKRVIGGREDPNQVLADMLPRYTSLVNAQPTYLSPPRFGNVNSIEDVRKVYAATKNASEQKAISQGDFDSQAQLLDSWRAFYAAKASRDAANIKVPFAKPAAKPEMAVQ